MESRNPRAQRLAHAGLEAPGAPFPAASTREQAAANALFASMRLVPGVGAFDFVATERLARLLSTEAEGEAVSEEAATRLALEAGWWRCPASGRVHGVMERADAGAGSGGDVLQPTRLFT